jgi:hypothetical protein
MAMDFFRRHRVLSLFLFAILVVVLIARITSPKFLTAQSTPTPPTAAGSLLSGAGGGGVCSKVGNNGAIQFGNSEVAFDEAPYTLALFSGAENEKTAIINAINNSSGKVIVRLGAGGTPPSGPGAAAYAATLNQIAASVNGKEFIAMAGHNEPNCNEYIPLANESIFVNQVANAVSAPNVTLITGQIDTYCGKKDVPAPINYINQLTTNGKIKGVALPFYTNVAGDANATVAHMQGFLKQIGGKDVYVTESGPYIQGTNESDAGQFEQYANAVKTIMNEPQIKAFLLFNAFGANPDPNYTYTKPFWNPDCRDPDEHTHTD